jgi:hypothetical protein
MLQLRRINIDITLPYVGDHILSEVVLMLELQMKRSVKLFLQLNMSSICPTGEKNIEFH